MTDKDEVHMIKPGTRVRVVQTQRDEIKPLMHHIYTVEEAALITVFTRTAVHAFVQYGVEEDSNIIFEADELEIIHEH